MVGVAPLAVVLASCLAGNDSDQLPLCNASGILKVGVMGYREVTAETTNLDPDELLRLRNLLTEASRCEVQIEPVRTSDLARSRLAARAWDVGFLPPGLLAFAMIQDPPYVPVRTLGVDRLSRSAILVPAESPIRSPADLIGARVGLLPRGSLTGFYLPLYNLHGLPLAKVSYALDYPGLLDLLNAGAVDAIAWDEANPEPARPLRRLLVDDHPIPRGAMVVSESIGRGNISSFLRSLDQEGHDLPPVLGYVPGALRQEASAGSLRSIVIDVESWELPLNDRPHQIFSPLPAGS